MENHQHYAKLFKALSDSKRLKILEILANGEVCACDLLEDLELSQSGLSYHMKILVSTDLVVARQEGKWTYYQIGSDGFALTKTFLDSFS